MIYLTGDTHGNFERIAHFCARMNTKKKDIMIILGDVGINFYGDWRDQHLKEFIKTVPATVVDHMIPHRGDMRLFWDKANWQHLCKDCHDRKTGMGL